MEDALDLLRGAARVRLFSLPNADLVAVGAGGTIYTSPDAVTWTLRPIATTEDLFGIARLHHLAQRIGAKTGGISADMLTSTKFGLIQRAVHGCRLSSVG